MKKIEENPLIIAAFLWLSFIAVAILTLPLLPIDETRYLSVAWEMKVNNNWILPTLNFAPYSHKPPLLFWLISIIWQITGEEIWSIRIMSGLITFLTLPLTYLLAKELFPKKQEIARYAPIITLASPVFFVFGTLIMFDFLLTIFVLTSLLLTIRAAKTGKFKYWLIIGLMIGFGILAKGPVMLLHIFFPIILAPLWAPKKIKLKYWYLGFFTALSIGITIALIWALSAAKLGGEEFANELFWGQSAGRITNSFAHKKPLWFFIPIVFLWFLPLISWSIFWQSIKTSLKNKREISNICGIKFIVSWIFPVFITFSLISGKQIHYLIPEFAGFAILFSALIFTNIKKYKNNKRNKLPFFIYLLLFCFFLFLPYLLPLFGIKSHNFYGIVFEAHSPIITILFITTFLLSYIYLPKFFNDPIKANIISFSIMSFLIISLFCFQTERKGFEHYDLKPIADALQPYKEGPIAVNRKYQGEITFLAKLTKPIERINNLEEWFNNNPKGIVIYRHKKTTENPKYKVIFEMDYKSNSHLALIKKL